MESPIKDSEKQAPLEESGAPPPPPPPPLSPGGEGAGLFAGLTMATTSPLAKSTSLSSNTSTGASSNGAHESIQIPPLAAAPYASLSAVTETTVTATAETDLPEMPLTETTTAATTESNPEAVESAPVTDKLLGLLDKKDPSPSAAFASPDKATRTNSENNNNNNNNNITQERSIDAIAGGEETGSAVMVESPETKETPPPEATPTSYSTMFGMSSWFGSAAPSTSKETPKETPEPASKEIPEILPAEKEPTASIVAENLSSVPVPDEQESADTLAPDDQGEVTVNVETISPSSPEPATQPAPTSEIINESDAPPSPADVEPESPAISRKEMDQNDQQALHDAFEQEPSKESTSETPTNRTIAKSTDMDAPTDEKRSRSTTATSTNSPPPKTTQQQPPSLPPAPASSNPTHTHIRGLGHLHPDTPVPNADICLRLLRKFAHKTRPRITTNYGGTKSQSIMSYMFGEKDDPTFVPYRLLMEILYESGQVLSEELQDESETENIVLGVLGESGNTMDMARRAMAAFCFLFSTWGHASAHQYERKDTKTREGFSDLLAAVFNAASTLVAHGCLDGIVTIIGDDMGGEASEAKAMPITNLFTESVLAADLNPERNELAAMKFLLSAGTRVLDNSGEAMLGGSHLLQTIRMLYHIFLTTESTSNKITARAALQQLVTHVFTRMAIVDMKIQDDPEAAKEWVTEDNFPTEHHRNAFLVLRAICKLSMRSMPDGASGSVPSQMHSHIGYQTSNSSEMWDGAQQKASSHGSDASSLPPPTKLHYDNERNSREHAQLIYTSAIHPALESKILALDLIHYVLTHTKFPPGFIMRSGPQFHAAIRNYLCVSLLKNCTSAETHVVNLSLRIFVPLVRNFRTILKNEIEAFVTNVFFVILDSPNSSADHKGIVVRTFDEICSDPATLAEIFLNYDCDLSAQDLFHRIVVTLSRVSRTGLHDTAASSFSIIGGSSASRMEKTRFETRELRLDAMKALRQVSASLHACMVKPMASNAKGSMSRDLQVKLVEEALDEADDGGSASKSVANGGVNPVEVYDSKKKRRAEEAEAIMRFNQKPTAGISYASKCGHIDGEDPGDVARYLLSNKDLLDKTMIGEYLGREAEYQGGFCLKVLHEYVRLMDFAGLLFDDAIRFFLSGFRLPGEAQKIDRIMEKFAERFTQQNPGLFPTADVAFILSFSIIMLQTDLHNPAIKEERRMTKEGFIRNNRGICDGQDLPEEMLTAIFDRIKANPFSLKEDDDARERAGDGKASSLPAGLSPASFFSSHYEEIDRERASNFQKERDHIVRTTESLLKRRRHNSIAESSKAVSKQKPKMSKHASQRFVRTEDSGLRDEYVAPMFEASWGPALAAFSTAIESANGTIGLLAIATDEELEIAAENAAETIEVCLTGFRFAICVAGLCGNDVARDSFMSALSRFTMLGSGTLMEPRHVRCIQTMLSLAREDGELIGSAWQHIFRALSEVNRFHQLFHLMARNDRAAAAAAERRRKRLEEKGNRKKLRQMQKAISDENDALPSENDAAESVTSFDSLDDDDNLFDDDDLDVDEDDMDAKAIDEANAKLVFEGVSEEAIESIYERSSSLSAPSIRDFVSQLCYVSSLDIRGGGGNNDLNKVSYRQQHALIEKSKNGGDQFHHSPNIFNLQKLVEVAHYNMDSRPRLIFNDLWKEIADHLSLVSLHGNPALAMYAVDSFRQLSVKYLQRDELEVFEFQRRFLKPLETIMAESRQDSTKELLLNCVARIIQVFEIRGPNSKGGLKSGWVPLLIVLGLGSQDENKSIALMSYNILNTQIEMCTKPENQSVLLSEHFSETVDAILKGVNGSHSEISNKALGVCSLLANYLSDDNFETQQLKKRSHSAEVPQVLDLELWWPLLLGVSKACGDERSDFRMTAMDTLFGLINDHFFPEDTGDAVNDVIQRLQLVFRGILSPLLEFAEIGTSAQPLPLPKGFERFLTKLPDTGKEHGLSEEPTDWLNTIVDPFMDSCIGMCKRSIEAYKNASLVEEVFALLNHCIVSDSGALAVRGVNRLEQFVTSDLDKSFVTDSVWATVCHMLQKALIVRGIPRKESGGDPATEEEIEEEYNMQVQEFVAEERMLSDRRYIGGHAVCVIDNILSSDRISSDMGFRWTFFLMNGLGKGIASWEEAASLLDGQKVAVSASGVPPPSYLENAMFGRKLLNRFLLQLASMDEVARATDDDESDYKAAQSFINDETHNLLATYNELVRLVRQGDAMEMESLLHVRFAKLSEELVNGYASLPHDHVRNMTWLSQTLLTSCVESKNEVILKAVRKFVQLSETEVGEPLEPPSPKDEPSTADDENADENDNEASAPSTETEAATDEGELTTPDSAVPNLAESPSDEEHLMTEDPPAVEDSMAEPSAFQAEEPNIDDDTAPVDPLPPQEENTRQLSADV